MIHLIDLIHGFIVTIVTLIIMLLIIPKICESLYPAIRLKSDSFET